jgi:hypothetical protein
MAPARSSRVLVKIPEITITRRNGGVKVNEPVIVKMKNSHREFLGLDALDGDDPILQGRFEGDGTNEGYKYLRNLGGFRARAVKLIARNVFTLSEENVDFSENPLGVNKTFKSIDIGFPQGVKVIEVFNWLRTLEPAVVNQIAYIRTWAGRKVDFTNVDNSPEAPAPDLLEPAD